MTTTKATLQILIETSTGSAQAQLNSIAQGLEAIDKKGKESAGGGLQAAISGIGTFAKAAGIAGGIAVGVGVAINKALDLGEAGANVIQTAESFEFLTQKLGLAPTLLDDLRVAANGTISDMKLMSATATLLAGASDELGQKLGNATPQLLEIAKAAQKLNPALGDTAFLYESIATGIKRASPMILDNLGLTIKIGDANEKYAAQLGKTVEQLTAEEQKVALLNATLLAGDALIQQVGGNTDSAADAYLQLDAEVANLTNTLKAGLHPTIEQLAVILKDTTTGLQEFFKWAGNSSEGIGELQQAVVDNTGSYEEYLAKIEEINSQLPWWVDNVESLTEAQYNQTTAMTKALQVQDEEARQIAVLVSNIKTQEEATEELTVATADLEQGLRQIAFQLSDPIGKATTAFIENGEVIREKIGEIALEIDELEQKDYLTGEQKEQLEGLRSELGDQQLALEELALKHEDTTNRILFGLIQQELAVGGWTTEEKRLLAEVGTAWGILDETAAETFLAIDGILSDFTNGESLTATKVALLELGVAVSGIAGDYSITFHVNTVGNLPSIDEDMGPGGTSTPPSEEDTGGGTKGGHEFGAHGVAGVVPSGFSEALGKPYYVGMSAGEGYAVFTREQMQMLALMGGGLGSEDVAASSSVLSAVREQHPHIMPPSEVRERPAIMPPVSSPPAAVRDPLVVDLRGAFITNERDLDRLFSDFLDRQGIRADVIRRVR